MSAIIDNASTIRFQRQASIAQTKSQSGRRQAQRRGPLLYNFYVEIRPLRFGSVEYIAIEDEILDLNYSTATTSATGGTQILLGNLITQRGVWSGTPVVRSASESGNTIDININNGDETAGQTLVTNYARKGDYVQFNNFTKVYQLTQNSSSDTNGNLTLSINGSVPSTSTPADDSAVVFGSSVLFNLQLKDRPEPEFSEANIVQYSSASFEEVI